jgi:hypothetical protein
MAFLCGIEGAELTDSIEKSFRRWMEVASNGLKKRDAFLSRRVLARFDSIGAFEIGQVKRKTIYILKSHAVVVCECWLTLEMRRLSSFQQETPLAEIFKTHNAHKLLTISPPHQFAEEDTERRINEQICIQNSGIYLLPNGIVEETPTWKQQKTLKSQNHKRKHKHGDNEIWEDWWRHE